MAFSINYDAILERIEEVSTIDTEDCFFIKEIDTDCPDCVFDPVYGYSSNIGCPTCGGSGRITEQKETKIVASIQRVVGTENIYQPGGRLQKGSIIMTAHEKELKRAGFDLNEDWSMAFDWIELAVDDRKVKYIIAEKDDIIPQTLQGEIYEIIFHLCRKS